MKKAYLGHFFGENRILPSKIGIFDHKRRILWSLVFIGFVAFLFPPSFAATQKDNRDMGVVSGSFLQITPDVRMAALGGDQAAARGVLGDWFSNPASLNALLVPEMTLTHNQSFIETRTSGLSLGFPVKSQAAGIFFQYVDKGSADRIRLDAYDDPVPGLGKFQYSTMRLQGGWALPITKVLSAGASLKGWNESRDTTSANGWAADVGIQIHSLIPRVDLGLVYRNVGPSQDDFSLPTSMAGGASLDLGAQGRRLRHLRLFTEADWADHRDTALRLGLEATNNLFWLRTGYESLESVEDESLSNFSFGGGLRIKGWKLDYAWVPRGDLGDQHRFSVSLGLGVTREERERRAQEIDKKMAARMTAQAESYFNEGQKAFTEGRLKDAKEAFANAHLMNSGEKKAEAALMRVEEKITAAEAARHFEKGRELAKKDRWLDAAWEWEKTLKLIPSHEKAKASLARARKKILQTSSGKSGSKKASHPAYEKGINHYVAGRYAAAVKAWEKARAGSVNKTHIKFLIEKAQKMILQEKLASMEKEAGQRNEEVVIWMKNAYTLYSLNMTEKAIRTWEKVLTVDPGNEEAREALAQARRKSKLMKGSPEVEVSPEVSRLKVQALQAYIDGDLKKAVSYWRRVLVLDPLNNSVRGNLRRVQQELATGEK